MSKENLNLSTNPAERISPADNARTFNASDLNLGMENKRRFEGMSGLGKKIACSFYEGVQRIPGVNNLVGKLEVAYNQFGLNRNEKKAAGLKDNMTNMGVGIKALDRSKESINSAIERAKKIGIGTESLSLQLKSIDLEKRKILDKQNKLQTKLEGRDNKMKLYAEKRDAVADKLINRFDEKLRPIDAKLEVQKGHKNEIELMIAGTEIRHKRELKEYDDLEAEKKAFEAELREAGFSEAKIRKLPGSKKLEQDLKAKRECVRREKELLNKRKYEIDKKIAKFDAKANPYRDRKQRYENIKAGRPLNIQIEPRKMEKYQGGGETIDSHPREEVPMNNSDNVKASKERMFAGGGSWEVEEEEQWLTFGQHIKFWNDYLKNTYKGDPKLASKIIDGRDLLNKMARAGIYEDMPLEPDEFKRIFAGYYKLKNKPMDTFEKDMKKMLKEMNKK